MQFMLPNVVLKPDMLWLLSVSILEQTPQNLIQYFFDLKIVRVSGV